MSGSAATSLASAEASASSAAAAAASPASSVVEGATGPHREAADVPGLFEAAPAGSQAWNDDWGTTAAPTAREWAARNYNPLYLDTIVANLTSDGLQQIAHVTWVAGDQDQADILLMRFTDDQGAFQHYETDVDLWSRNHSLIQLDGVSGVTAYASTPADPQGNIRAHVYGQFGNVTLEFDYFSPGTLLQPDLDAWAAAEVALLH